MKTNILAGLIVLFSMTGNVMAQDGRQSQNDGGSIDTLLVGEWRMESTYEGPHWMFKPPRELEGWIVEGFSKPDGIHGEMSVWWESEWLHPECHSAKFTRLTDANRVPAVDPLGSRTSTHDLRLHANGEFEYVYGAHTIWYDSVRSRYQPFPSGRWRVENGLLVLSMWSDLKTTFAYTIERKTLTLFPKEIEWNDER